MTIKSHITNRAFVLHLVRGVVGAVCLEFAIHVLPEHLAVGLLLAFVALAAFRGCPTCWLGGLFSVCSKGGALPAPDKPVAH